MARGERGCRERGGFITKSSVDPIFFGFGSKWENWGAARAMKRLTWSDHQIKLDDEQKQESEAESKESMSSSRL